MTPPDYVKIRGHEVSCMMLLGLLQINYLVYMTCLIELARHGFTILGRVCVGGGGGCLCFGKFVFKCKVLFL